MWFINIKIQKIDDKLIQSFDDVDKASQFFNYPPAIIRKICVGVKPKKGICDINGYLKYGEKKKFIINK